MTIRWLEDGSLLLNLYIQPKASRNQIVGLHDEKLKIAITAPPVDGKANNTLIRFLAKEFKVPKSQVVIEKGQQGRHKQVRIIAPRELAAINELIEES